MISFGLAIGLTVGAIVVIQVSVVVQRELGYIKNNEQRAAKAHAAQLALVEEDRRRRAALKPATKAKKKPKPKPRKKPEPKPRRTRFDRLDED